MTNSTGIQYGSGFRFGLAYELNTAGRLKGLSAVSAYQGLPFVGGKAWNLTIPKQRRINHMNADRVGAADFLPPSEAASGTIVVSADNQQMDAILTNNKQVIIGQASTQAMLSSQQGFEPLIALLLWQQSLDSVSRLRAWRSFLVPRAKAIPLGSGFADREVDGTYDVLMTPSSTNIFGAALTALTDGATDTQLFRAMTAGRPAICAWIGDGYTVDFVFPTGSDPLAPIVQSPTIDVNSVTVWKNGVKLSTGFTVTTLKVTLGVAPLVTDDINIFWEY